jgi:translation elongation factor P/translation initiation factor 5A
MIDPADIKALRAMAPAQRLKRGLHFMEQARQFKIASVHVHHPGWSDEKVMSEVRRWIRDGMKPEELYEL